MHVVCVCVRACVRARARARACVCVCICMGSTVNATFQQGPSNTTSGNVTAPKSSRAIGVVTLTSMKFTLLIYAVALIAALSVI